jgi:hypothetical protein
MVAVSHAVDPAATGDLARQFDDGLRAGQVLLGWAALHAWMHDPRRWPPFNPYPPCCVRFRPTDHVHWTWRTGLWQPRRPRGSPGRIRMTSEPISDPLTDSLLTPQNVVIDYKPSQNRRCEP